MKKLLLLITILMLFLANNVKASEEYFNFKLVKTNFEIKNVKIKLIKEFADKNQCGEAIGGNKADKIQSNIILSTSKLCKPEFEKHLYHELLHIWDFQHGRISEKIAKDWECFQDECEAKEKFAYWITDWRFAKDDWFIPINIKKDIISLKNKK